MFKKWSPLLKAVCKLIDPVMTSVVNHPTCTGGISELSFTAQFLVSFTTFFRKINRT